MLFYFWFDSIAAALGFFLCGEVCTTTLPVRPAHMEAREGVLVFDGYCVAFHFVTAEPSKSTLIIDEAPGQNTLFAKQSDLAWKLGSENCCGDLGCFELSEVFVDFIKRPINLFPSCETAVSFKLTTRDNVDATEVIDVENVDSVRSSHFRGNREGTKVIVHGFLDNGDVYWMSLIEKKLLIEGDFNVIKVEWASGDIMSYFQAAANARVVAAKLAKILQVFTDEFGQEAREIHIVGHSLGAHIAGYAGKLVHVGKITGLDPAGLYFMDMPPAVRLDLFDADLVETIITDGREILKMGYGSIQPMGHINFYPNGGKDQPGCQLSLLPNLFDPWKWVAGLNVLGCSHFRAPLLYADSIANPMCDFVAVHCNSYEEYKKGSCFSCELGHCLSISRQTNPNWTIVKQPQKFFLDTNAEAPFCTRPYRIRIALASDFFQEKGTVQLLLHGRLNSTAWIALTPDPVDLIPGNELVLTTAGPANFGPLSSASLRWYFSYSLLRPFGFLRNHKINVEILEVTPLGEKPIILKALGEPLSENVAVKFERSD